MTTFSSWIHYRAARLALWLARWADPSGMEETEREMALEEAQEAAGGVGSLLPPLSPSPNPSAPSYRLNHDVQDILEAIQIAIDGRPLQESHIALQVAEGLARMQFMLRED